MLLGTDSDPFALDTAQYRAIPAAWPLFPFLDNWTLPAIPGGEGQFNAPDVQEVAFDAARYDALRTYRDVKFYSDAEILLMDKVDAIKLYYNQFLFSAAGECATNRDLHNCPQLTLSDYTQSLRAASRARPNPNQRTFPNRFAPMYDGPYYHTINDLCHAYAPELPPGGSGWTDRKWLFNAGRALMQRIYDLRPDLREVTNPDTGEPMTGLIEPLKLVQGLPPCMAEKTVADYVGVVVRGILATIVPYGGWVAIIPDTVEMLNERKKAAQMIDRLNVIVQGVPSGISTLLNERRVNRQWTDAATAAQMETSPEAQSLASTVGLPYAAMICPPAEPCPPTRQISLLKSLIDDWNTNRLIARRVAYEAWRNEQIRVRTPDWSETDWSKKLSQQAPYGGDCMWTPGASVCREGSAGFKQWAADTKAALNQGPVPPAPSRSLPRFDRDTLDHTDSILKNTGWFLAQNEVETLLNAVAPPVPPEVIRQATPQNPTLPDIPLPTVNPTVTNQPSKGAIGLLAAAVAALVLS